MRWSDHFAFSLSVSLSLDHLISLCFLSPPSPQSGQSPLDMVRTETRKGRALFRLMKKWTVSPTPCSFLCSTSPPLLSSLLCSVLFATVAVALLPSQSLQSESRPRPTPRQGPRPGPKSEPEHQADFVEEGGRDL
jgi:hypothetical protein